MITAYIALGSNLNSPIKQLQQAIAALADFPDTNIDAVSPVYRSRAVGPGQQSDYLNAVTRVQTALAPETLLDHLQAQETRQGRERKIRWGARTLDLDILLYDDRVLDSDRLTIPHAEMQNRHFVLYPLADIAGPDFMLPCGDELGTLLQRCPRDDLTVTEMRLDATITNQGARPDAG